jgi:hypothetical protein
MTLRIHLNSAKMAIINNTNNKCWQGRGEKEHFYTVGENVN